MAENNFLNYKGKPLVRSGKEIFYGDMADAYVIKFTVLYETKEDKLPEKVTVQLLKSDTQLPDKDRIVKEKFNKWVNPCTCPKEFPVCVCGNKPLGKLVFKSKAPTEAELEENPRARS